MKAIDVAKLFLGEKEKPGNGGFYNEKLQAIMTEAGHKKGEAWCCYFAEACFCEAVKGTVKEDELRTLFSGNCVQTFHNFQRSGKYTISRNPVAGALVIYQRWLDGVPLTKGHAGIVIVANTISVFYDVEGNTNTIGNPEGDSVQIKRRSTKAVTNGLSVLGFIIIEP